jgi:hypothetical protein
MILPETPEKLLGVINKSGLYMYSTEEWKDVAGIKKYWYYKAEIYSISWMYHGADTYISNPSVDYDINQIIGNIKW